MAGPSDESRLRSGLSHLAAVWGGPLLILAANLTVLHDLAFGGMLPNQRADVLAFWLPNQCFLEASLNAGSIPGWNPWVMAGVPFAADPQSGWMYLPSMISAVLLPCEAAIRWQIVFHPILAGLGLYWFLREEGLSREAATLGGLAMSLGISASEGLLHFFAPSLAWTTVLLGATARFLRASPLASRFGWGAVAALAWGQVAAAFLSHGLVLGTLAFIVYWFARMAVAGRRQLPAMVLAGGVLLVSFLAVNLAVLLPRLAYLPRTTLGLGYDGLGALASEISGSPVSFLHPENGTGLSWPLRFAIWPGPYMGAVLLAVSLAGWWSRRHRYIVVAMSAFGALTYFLALRTSAEWVAGALQSAPLADFYLSQPARWIYGLFLALPILGAVGVEAWQASSSWRRRILMGVPGVVLWIALPILIGVPQTRPWSLAALSGLGIIALVASGWRPALLATLPAVTALELLVGAVAGQETGKEIVPIQTRDPGWRRLANLVEPNLQPSAYFAESPMIQTLRVSGVGRYIGLVRRPSDYVDRWRREDRALLNNQRGVLFGVEDAQGYNPVQLRPYWTLVRLATRTPVEYNLGVLTNPPAAALDLLQVTWVLGRVGEPPLEGLTPTVSEGKWVLYRRAAPPRASVFTDWTIVPEEDRALETVLERDPDSADVLVLQRDPGIRPSGRPGETGTAHYQPLGTQDAQVIVRAPAASVVLVRNAYDRHWQATVDGRPSTVLRAEYMLQAIPVPRGDHTIVLRYRDPWIVRGLVGSAASLIAMIGAATAFRFRWRWVPSRDQRLPLEPQSGEDQA